ncbi:MAG: ATP-binding protein [Polyangiaceae bacterium]
MGDGQPQHGDAALAAARRGVLRVTMLSLFAAVPLLTVVTAHRISEGLPIGAVSAAFASVVVLAGFLWAHRNQPPHRGGIAVTTLFGALNLFSLLQFGPLVGLGTMLVVFVLLCVLFFGRALPPVLISVAQLIVVALAAEAGWLKVPWELPADGFFGWVRMVTAVGIVLALCSYSFRHLLRALVAAISHEVEARNAQAKAQREREASQRVLANSRRLEAVGRLAGGVAHDFNNALTVLIAGVASLRDSDGEDTQELLDEMERAAQGARATTRQLLSFARQGTVPTDAALPAKSLSSLAKSLGRLLPENIHVRAELEPVPAVSLSSGELEQVILNLCLNARDAMPDGGQLVLRTALEPAAAHVVVEVEDSGLGMPAEVKGQALEPFFTTKQEGQGTGLGLSMVHEAVSQCGGDLEIDSEPGRGTTVRLRLPIAQVHAGSDPEQRPSREHRSGSRVLLLEDDAGVRRALTRVLQHAGYGVVPTATVAEAIDRVSGESFDLLLTDASLPDGDPGRLIHQFRARAKNGPVLVCSGHIDSAFVLDCIEHGEYEFLQKPVEPAVLTDTIAQLLHREERAPESAPNAG